MPQATYRFSPTSGTNYDLARGENVRGVLARTSEPAPPSGARIVSATLSISAIKVYSQKDPYIEIENFGDTDKLATNSSVHSITTNLRLWSNSILSVSSQSNVWQTARTSGASTTVMNIRSDATITITVNYDETNTYVPSTATVPETVVAGAPMRVTLANSNQAKLAHKVTWVFGSMSDSRNVAQGVGTVDFTPPLSWISQIPTANSGTGSVVVQTYAGSVGGTYIGQNTYPFTMTVPDTDATKPTVGSLTAAVVNNSVPPAWGIYLQNLSGVTLTANSPAGNNGSTVSTYTFKQGETVIGTTNGVASFTVNPIPISGSVTYSVVVTDSRGKQSAPKSVTIPVQPYTAPTFTDATAFRCMSNHEASETGTYIGVRAAWSFTAQEGKNTVSATCHYHYLGDSAWISGLTSMTTGEDAYLGKTDFDPDRTTEVKFTIKDQFRTVEKVVTVSTAAYTMFFAKGGNGVAFGKASEHENSVEIAQGWTLYYNNQNFGDILEGLNSKIIYSAVEPAGSEGKIWLKPR